MSPVPLCSNCAALMFDDIGPLIPNRLNPIKKQQQTNKETRKIKKTIMDYRWTIKEENCRL